MGRLVLLKAPYNKKKDTDDTELVSDLKSPWPFPLFLLGDFYLLVLHLLSLEKEGCWNSNKMFMTKLSIEPELQHSLEQ